MNHKYEKTGGYARNARRPALKAVARILKSKIRERSFDPVAYAAALEILG